MSTNWDRLEDIFATALELDPDERPALLERECSGAPELRGEIESLLAAHEQAEVSFTSRSVAVRDILGALGGGLLTGKKLGAYQMESIVGEGGMGVVYRALDERANTHVAVKVLPHELALDSPWRRRLAREVRAAAAICHPNVVRVLDYGEDAGCLFLVMDLTEGQTLRARLAEGALPLDKVLDYGIEIAQALEAAHAAGVIHHDLKPGNIMVTPGEQIKVVDFGLSRFEDDSGDSSRTRLSQAGTPAGTIDYLSPEQAGGRPVDTRSDLFAFGSVFYEMLTGKRVFRRATNLETAAAILRDQPAPLPEAVPEPVAALVETCLAKDVKKRVQSATALRSSLEALREKLRQGKLQSRRFRRARSMAMRAVPAAIAIALLAFIVNRGRAPVQKTPGFQRLTDDPHVTMDPALSWDGRWLAYASDRAEDGNLDIWIQAAGQGNPRRLTFDPAADHETALSPDGSQLAFRSERQPAGIYAMPVQGGSEHLLAAGGRGPQFSPDGRWIAYWSGAEVNGDAQMVVHTSVFVVPAQGGTPRLLAKDLVAASHPVWAPDSRRVLFAGHRRPDSGTAELWAASLVDGAVQLKARWPRDLWNSEAPPTPCAWTGNDVVLVRWSPIAQHFTTTHVWSIRLPAQPATQEAVSEQLTSGVGNYTGCSADQTGRIVVANAPRRAAIWSLPIDPASGRPRAAVAPLALEGERAEFPSMSADGSLLLFRATDPRGVQRWTLRNLANGEDQVVKSGKSTDPVLLTRDGRWMATGWVSKTEPDAMALPASVGWRWFHVLPFLWDASRDGVWGLSTTGSRPRAVALGNVRSDRVQPLLAHPDYSLYLPNFSPDDRWILVTAENGLDPPRLFAVPFREPYPIPVTDWVDLGEGLFGRWAPSGDRVYFLREHQGSRCIYTRALDPATKRPVSEAIAVLHIHSTWRSPTQLDPGTFKLIVGPDRLVFPMGEVQSNLWIAQP